MPEVVAACLKQLEVLHRDLNRALEGLSAEALNWSPGSEVNSLAVLATHTAGAERYWIGDVIAQEDSHRDRESEFHVQVRNAEEIIERLDAALAYSRSVIQSLTSKALEEQRPAGEQRVVTVAWALVHTLEHTGIHLGQMQLMRHWWEARAH